ncbi:alpha-tectorin-like [Scyliorhinus canicula]|uniref:alpha-tectorin-like n=1 Tax=Scyliorhinus canicula TaxID=7830 RepID=UPI0018F5830E|nr:alpha-tectorin-like [Scyliorhinus canicula]
MHLLLLISMLIPPAFTTTPADQATGSPINPASQDPCAEESCVEWETCGLRYGKSGCRCTNVSDSGSSETFDYALSCNGTNSSVSLSRCMLFDVGFSSSDFHLNDPRCVGYVSHGRLIFSFASDRIICGNKLQVNSTHFIYSNTIRVKAETGSGSIVIRKPNVTIDFLCVYPLTMNISSTVVISAVHSVVNITLPSGKGLFETKMFVYREPGYTEPFTQTPVLLGVNDKIYVGTIVSGIDANQFVLTLSHCWATPRRDPNTPTQWSFITGQCPSVLDGSVSIEENGLSPIARFSLNIFRFVGDSSEVYIHCQIQLCNFQSTNCLTQCLGERSGVSQTNGTVHTTGPFKKMEGQSNRANSRQIPWLAMMTLCFTAIFGCFR